MNQMIVGSLAILCLALAACSGEVTEEETDGQTASALEGAVLHHDQPVSHHQNAHHAAPADHPADHPAYAPHHVAPPPDEHHAPEHP